MQKELKESRYNVCAFEASWVENNFFSEVATYPQKKKRPHFFPTGIEISGAVLG